jgi:methyl-accepting chemotaxis protein
MKNPLQNAPIGVKVALAPAFAIACLALVAALGWIANRATVADLREVGGAGLERVQGAQALSARLAALHRAFYQSLVWEAIGQRPERLKALDDGLLKELVDFGKAADAAAADGRLSARQREAMADFAKGYASYTKVGRDTLDIKSSGLATAASLIPTLDIEFKASAARLDRVVSDEVDASRAAIAGAEAAAQRNLGLVGLAVGAAVLLAVALAWGCSRSITLPLAQAAGVAGSLAEGDLTRQVGAVQSDATGLVLQALQEVSHNLGRLVAEIRSTADEISTASGEIAAGNADLSSRTESAASSLQQTVSSIGELSQNIRSSAEHASQADRLAHEAQQVALEGGAAMGEVVQTMQGISAQARQIGEIVGVIDGIAFQTNILALNAAVEAARAGEQGRGFAVVAQEVRTLAGRSGEAAREIRRLIARSVEQVEAGSAKVQVAGATMARIVEAIERVTGMVEAISQATAQQSQGIAQVNQAVAEMDRATQQNAAMVEQASAATDSLSTQSRGLVALLARFRTAA